MNEKRFWKVQEMKWEFKESDREKLETVVGAFIRKVLLIPASTDCDYFDLAIKVNGEDVIVEYVEWTP